MAPKCISFTLAVALFVALGCDCKIYSNCEFARALATEGITDRQKLGTWTCIAYHESRFDTKAVDLDTGDYGILQISHYFWCSDTNRPGKGCGITCKSLLGDDITPDIHCAKTVYAKTEQRLQNGFKAWTTYEKYCLGDQSRWISGCSLDDIFSVILV